jgi:hypothetical protein
MGVKAGCGIEVNLPLEEGDEGRFNRIKPWISLTDLDTDKKIKPQIEAWKKAINIAWTEVSALLEEKIEEELDRKIDRIVEKKLRERRKRQ